MTLTDQKPILVILPSPLIMASNYLRLASLLKPLFHVIILELPETGHSYSWKKVWSSRDYAHYVRQYLTDRQLSNVYLLGYSNSGAIAVETAALFPDKIAGIVLADTIGVRTQSGWKLLKNRMKDAGIEFLFSLKATPNLLFNAFFHPRNFIRQVWDAPNTDLNSRFPEVRSKVLVAWGGRDHTVNPDQAHELTLKVPSADLYLSPTGSHDWILTNPVEFTTAIQQWMEHHSTAKQLEDSSNSSDRSGEHRIQDEILTLRQNLQSEISH